MSSHALRVALIDPSLFTVPYDAKLAAALRGAGHDVALYGEAPVAATGQGELPELRPLFYRELAGIGTDRWPRQAVRLAKGALHAASMRRLTAELRRTAPDVIHFQWTPLPAVDRFFICRLRELAPVVLTAHDSRPFNGSAWRLQKWGATRILGEFDGVIVHTEEARTRLVSDGLPSGRVVRIAHGLLDEAVPVAPQTAAPRTAMAAPDRVRFLLFGKLKPYKGADLLIEAFRRLPPELRQRAELHIVGKPYMDVAPLREAARGLGESVKLDLRFVPDEEMGAMLGQADVVVFPYREIDVSGVLMAALRYGRPIIASAIGGFAELLTEGRHGILVPPNDAGALAAAMARLCGDPPLRAAMGAAVAELGAAVPSWEAIASRTAEFYRSVLAARQNQRSGTKTTSPGPTGVMSVAAQRRRSGSP
ncbi:MAG TPA: glycosyltransferase family 4 protein [Stellaceae bacterium]|nr:glycosyltransferase family 4 protein [Stellaceae bacterium]